MLCKIWLIWLDSLDKKWNSQYDGNDLAAQFWQMESALTIDWHDDQSPLREQKYIRLWIYNRQIHVVRNEWKKPSQFYKTKWKFSGKK